MKCTNCGGDDAKRFVYDIDLPVLTHCHVCAFLIVADPDMYDEVAGRPIGTSRQHKQGEGYSVDKPQAGPTRWATGNPFQGRGRTGR